MDACHPRSSQVLTVQKASTRCERRPGWISWLATSRTQPMHTRRLRMPRIAHLQRVRTQTTRARASEPCSVTSTSPPNTRRSPDGWQLRLLSKEHCSRSRRLPTNSVHRRRPSMTEGTDPSPSLSLLPSRPSTEHPHHPRDRDEMFFTRSRRPLRGRGAGRARLRVRPSAVLAAPVQPSPKPIHDCEYLARRQRLLKGCRRAHTPFALDCWRRHPPCASAGRPWLCIDQAMPGAPYEGLVSLPVPRLPQCAR